MPEPEQNDVNSVQSVTEQSEQQPVAQAEGVPVESLTTEQVPFNEDPKIQEYIQRQVGKVTEKLTTLEQQNQQYQQMLMQQNAQQPQQPMNQEEQIKAYLKSRSIDPDYATPVQMAQVVMELNEEYRRSINNQMQDQQLMSQIPDFATVVGAPNAFSNGQFVPSQPLIQYVQQHPEQSQIIMQNLQTPQGKRLVYQAIVNDPVYRKANLDAQTVPKVTKEAQAMINNANSIGSISNVGSASAMDKTAQLTAMDDVQFKAHLESVKARA